MPEIITGLSLYDRPPTGKPGYSDMETALREIVRVLDRAAAQGKGSKPIAPKLDAEEMKRLHKLAKDALRPL